MIKVGLTGGIGSGKTTVSLIFEKLGIPVFYADNEAKKVIHSDENVKQEIIRLFGKEIYLETGELDRSKMASIVFSNKEALEQLNAIVHPAVKNSFDNWEKLQQTHYIIKEAAILFESGSYKEMDQIITVTAPVELRVNRVVSRDKVNQEQINQRIANQIADEERISKSNFIVVNDDKNLIIPQILKIHMQLLKMQ
jgi:dephospho-CoA kinase